MAADTGAPDETFDLTSEDPAAVRKFLSDRGWGDGLPIVVPTKSRVDEFLALADADPEELIGIIPPRLGQGTNRVIAVNAVMASMALGMTVR